MKKKLLSSVLAMSMLASMSTTAVASFLPEIGYIGTPNGSTEVPVELNVTPLTFSVSVPSALPITVNGDGEVTVATNTKIINNSQGKVEVKDLVVNAQGSWKLVPMTDDFAGKAVNTKEFGVSFNKADAATTELETTFAVINANSEQAFSYAANLAPQSEEILGEQIASAVFTIGWKTDEVEIITFTINDGMDDTSIFQAEKGMTWGEWINSAYNVDGYTSFEYDDGAYAIKCPEGWLVEDTLIRVTDTIEAITYTCRHER